MKKMLLAGAAVFAALAMASAASAQSTTVGATWNGNVSSLTFTANGAGSSTGAFSTWGNGAIGSVSYVNLANDPYGYGVSNTSLNANARVTAGGLIQSTLTRDGSGGMYGPAGQSISASAYSSDGGAALVQHANVNFASMNDIGYGQSQTAGGNTLDASGTAIQLNYVVNTGQLNNSAGFLLTGTGTAAVDLASSGVSANSFGMGQGQGIYTQGQFSGTGQGTVSTGAMATSSLFVANSGSTVYGTLANPASVSTLINYATSGAQVQSWNFAIGGVR